VIYPFLLSPVRHIPGPWYARVSKIPLQYATYKRRRTEFVTKLLNRYGAVVVVAPDQVHTSDDTAMKTIYDKSSTKTSFYSSMGSWKGVTSTLGFLDYAAAAPSRNNLIQCFQNRNLATLVESIQSHVDDFLALLEDKCEKGEAVDGVVVFRLLALDIVTDVLWGEENRLLRDFKVEQAPVFLRRFHAFSTWNATKSFIPGADFLVKYFGNKKWKGLRKDCNDMDETAQDALARWLASKNSAHRDKDVLSMLQSMNKANVSAVPTADVPAYMVEMLAAGSSTTSHTAAFTCWLLTRNPEAQARLREELLDAFPDVDTLDIKKTIDLPFLDAVIRETMRMYPMIPGPLERYLGKDITVAGKLIPRGIIASNAAYNQGRLESVYNEAGVWKPERWNDATESMKFNWTPFGHGCRACPGSNLAMTELKYMIGMIFRNFKAVMPPGQSNDVLELSDVFAAGSRTGHCWLKFDKL
jgi:cytochrome P450